MKSLVIAEDFPWPPTAGGLLRLVKVIETIAQLGETDLFALTYPRRRDPCDIPPGLDLRRSKTLTVPKSDFSASRRLKWLVSPGVPLELAAQPDLPIKAEFTSWADRKYDFVWCSRVATFDQVGRPHLGPTVVDIDDLEDEKLRSRLALMWKDGNLRDPRQTAHNLAASVQTTLNARRWHKLEISVARSVEQVVLCSLLDATRLGEPNATVIPNGFDITDEPAGKVEVGEPPTLLMQGSLKYGPNADAARWLAEEIVPLIRAEIPDVRVRLVGDPDDVVSKLHDPPRVTVTGRVPSMLPELAQADLVVVPIRYGSGTRVKILESFANRIPVVSTVVGAEGLDLEDGHQLLLAQDAAGFAKACVVGLKDIDLRRRLVAAAEERFRARHQWSTAQARIRDLALATAGAADRSDGQHSDCL
jgi:glycosyltransferase involved in cell wall biosynthesis